MKALCISIAFLTLLVGIGGCSKPSITTPGYTENETVSTETPTPTLTPTPSIADAVYKVNPAVVRVITDVGMGSGMIIDKAGYVLTNSHVIEGSQSIRVVFADKREYPASVVGRDEMKDLAILKIIAIDLPVATLGNSEKLTPGDEVIAIGYPLDLTGSATISRGIVSAFRNDNKIGLTYIQTDASINPGSSGGALINLAGEVVGINVMTIRLAGGLTIEGMNFAIAIESAKPIIPKLIAGETVLKPWLTYTDSLRGFTIQYPNTWKVMMVNVSQTPSYQGSVVFQGPGAVNASVMINSDFHSTLTSLVDMLTGPNTPTFLRALSRRDLLWQGIYRASELTYQKTRTRDSTVLEQEKRLIVIREGNLYQVIASTLQSEYELYSSTIDTIINSFQLDK